VRSRAWILAAGLAICGTAGHAQTGLSTFVYAAGFASPVGIVQDPTNPVIQFVVEQGGRIRTVRAGSIVGDFLDIRADILSGGERGLLGLAFAPDYATSGRFYVNFTDPSGNTVIARFLRSTDLLAFPASRFDLKIGGAPSIAQPYPNHNGGQIAFGPDGYLYIGMGDGGSGNDPENRAQDPTTFLGKMLRIDVDVPLTDPAGYRAPADNPWAAGPAGWRPEIWSVGLRNPWRFSFDSVARGGTGALVIADVGQGAFEEIDYEPRGIGGRNYGWRVREGAHDNVTSPPPLFFPLTEPILDYSHAEGSSITGGFVYRGTRLAAAFRGRYFFADFVAGRVWSIGLALDAQANATVTDRIEHTAELNAGAPLGNISSFGLDAGGELFVVNYAGSILKIVDPTIPPPTPTNLRIVP
jgi:glucose/arabinose dehydrogenase